MEGRSSTLEWDLRTGGSETFEKGTKLMQEAAAASAAAAAAAAALVIAVQRAAAGEARAIARIDVRQ